MAHRPRPASVALTVLAAATTLAATSLAGCGSTKGATGASSGASSSSAAASTSATSSSPVAGSPATTPSHAVARSQTALISGSTAAAPPVTHNPSLQSQIAQAAADAPISPVITVAPSEQSSGVAAPAAAVAVIRKWSDALRSGDVHAAATYFQIPSELINGPNSSGQFTEEQIATEAEAVEANTLLPCGAQLVSTDRRGEWVNALFILTSRPGPGGGCGDSKTTSRVNFIIHAGKIVDWLIAPPQPGDTAVLTQQSATTTRSAAPKGPKLRA